MSAFFVGQRVRIIRVDVAIEALGKEAFVVGYDDEACDGFEFYEGYDVCVDGIGKISPRGFLYCFPAYCLEPILPDGHRPAELTVEELLPFVRETVHA